LSVLRNENRQCAFRLEPHELDMFEPHIDFGSQHDASRACQAGQHLRSFGQHGFDRFSGLRTGNLGLNRSAVLLGQVANLHQRIDKEPQTNFSR
jgi:hypothetical protein